MTVGAPQLVPLCSGSCCGHASANSGCDSCRQCRSTRRALRVAWPGATPWRAGGCGHERVGVSLSSGSVFALRSDSERGWGYWWRKRAWRTQAYARSDVRTASLDGFDSGPTYSNFGYYMAGEIGRKLSGKISLETACALAIWRHLGADRPRATRVLAAEAWADAEAGEEVLYHPVFPGYGGSIAVPNGLLEPNWYDTYTIPQELAPSGWAMAAADYARFLTAFAEPANPLFANQGTQAEMLRAISAAGGGAFARGFGLVSEAGHDYVWHNGGFPGSSSFGFLRDDGLVVVFIANRNTSYNQFGGGWATQFAQVIDNAVTTPGPEHDLWSAVDLNGAS